jgi:hypothetical protein
VYSDMMVVSGLDARRSKCRNKDVSRPDNEFIAAPDSM